MNKRDYAFGKTNFILLAAGMLVVIIGFLLMGGMGSNEHVFMQDIFGARRIKVAPALCFIGFISIVYAIMHRSKDDSAKGDISEVTTTE